MYNCGDCFIRSGVFNQPEQRTGNSVYNPINPLRPTMFASPAVSVATSNPTSLMHQQPPNLSNNAGATLANCASPDAKYTIEQIELLRRLKNSGLSKIQIVQGLESLEKIDVNGFTTPTDLSGASKDQEINVNPKANILPNGIGQLGTLNSGTTGADYLRTLALQQAFFNAMTNGNFVNGGSHLQQTNIGATLAQRNLAAALMCSQGINLPGMGGIHSAAATTNGALTGTTGFHHAASTNAAENSILNQMSHINSNGGGGGGASSPINLKREANVGGNGLNNSLGDPSTISDDDEHLVQLQSMSVVDTKEEIKQFMLSHGIKQHQVAEKTGVSQSYISQFLHQGVWMKDSTRTNIYKWYLDEKRKREANGDLASPVNSSRGNSPVSENMNSSAMTPPGAISSNHTTQGQSQQLPMSSNNSNNSATSPQMQQINNQNNNNNNNAASGMSSSPMVSNGIAVIAHQTPVVQQVVKKRDRFVWKESCVSLLEKFYCVNPYPDDTKREEIAAACNQLIDSTGQGHDEKMVTAVKVYNWFANRRKEIKRKNHFAEQQAANNLLGGHVGVLPFLLDSKVAINTMNNNQSNNSSKPHLPQQTTSPSSNAGSASGFGYLDELMEHNRAANLQNQPIVKEELKEDYTTHESALKLCQMMTQNDCDQPHAKKPKISLADQLAEVNNAISELVPGNEENSILDEKDELRNDSAMNENNSTEDELESKQPTFDVLNLTSDRSQND